MVDVDSRESRLLASLPEAPASIEEQDLPGCASAKLGKSVSLARHPSAPELIVVLRADAGVCVDAPSVVLHSLGIDLPGEDRAVAESEGDDDPVPIKGTGADGVSAEGDDDPVPIKGGVAFEGDDYPVPIKGSGSQVATGDDDPVPIKGGVKNTADDDPVPIRGLSTSVVRMVVDDDDDDGPATPLKATFHAQLL